MYVWCVWFLVVVFLVGGERLTYDEAIEISGTLQRQIHRQPDRQARGVTVGLLAYCWLIGWKKHSAVP